MNLPDNYIPDIPLVLYGAGITAGFVYESFREKGIKAVSFADSDKSKKGKPAYRGSDLTVLSIDEVKKMIGEDALRADMVVEKTIELLVNSAKVK